MIVDNHILYYTTQPFLGGVVQFDDQLIAIKVLKQGRLTHMMHNFFPYNRKDVTFASIVVVWLFKLLLLLWKLYKFHFDTFSDFYVLWKW